MTTIFNALESPDSQLSNAFSLVANGAHGAELRGTEGWPLNPKVGPGIQRSALESNVFANRPPIPPIFWASVTRRRDLRSGRFLTRWTALTLSFPTRVSSSRTELTVQNYGAFTIETLYPKVTHRAQCSTYYDFPCTGSPMHRGRPLPKKLRFRAFHRI